MSQANNQHANRDLSQITHARAGKITDEILDQIIEAATKAQQGITLSESEASLILLTVPQAFAELRQRRAVMDLISEATDLDNVVFIPNGRRS